MPRGESQEGLLRGASLEELVASPHSMPLGSEGAPLSLKLCLEKLFEAGWDPDCTSVGLARLSEETVLWVKSFERAKATADGLPPTIMDLVESFRNMLASTKELDAKHLEVEKVITHANRAVESRYQLVSEAADARELAGKKAALENWLSKIRQTCASEVESLNAHHAHVREIFEKKIQDVVMAAYEEHKASQQVPLKLPDPLADAETLHLSLDAELELAMSKPDPELSPSLAEPKKTVTGAFEDLQQTVEQTLQANEVPEALRAAVVDNLQTIIKDALQNPAAPKPELRRSNAIVEPQHAEAEKPKDPSAIRVEVMDSEFKRLDTSELEKRLADDPDAVLVDGQIFYKAPKGHLETLEKRQKRVAHNNYMKFSRSLEGELPDAVAQKAAGRKHSPLA